MVKGVVQVECELVRQWALAGDEPEVGKALGSACWADGVGGRRSRRLLATPSSSGHPRPRAAGAGASSAAGTGAAWRGSLRSGPCPISSWPGAASAP